jgi:beta-glucosidase
MTAEENWDRSHITLLEMNTADFIAKQKELGKKTILLVTTPGATVINSRDKFDSIIANFLAGERFTDALFDVVEGKVNPSGKLPFTMPNVENE